MGNVIIATTHAEFLYKAFGVEYKAWMKSRWKYDENTWVWMVRFDGKIRDGWMNCIVNENEIWEKYIGDVPPAYKADSKKYRIVVQILEGAAGREYHILGKFQYSFEKSGVGCHILERV